MNLKLLYFLLLFPIIAFGQSHNINLKAGYVIATASVPDNSASIQGDDLIIEQGGKWFESRKTFQAGILSNIDVGSDFAHIDVGAVYSNYGFKLDETQIEYSYLDAEIGMSNMTSAVGSKFLAGVSVIPSFLISEPDESLGDFESFDLKIGMFLGYRFYKDYSVYLQGKFGILDIIPESKIRNIQFSLNLNIPIFKINV